MIRRYFYLLTCLLCFPALLNAADPAVREQIRERVERVPTDAGLVIEGQTAASLLVLPALYEQRDFAALWIRPEAADQLLNVLDHIDADGLDAADYHTAELKALRTRIATSGSADAGLRADYDILLTDSLIRLGYHLQVGKVDPVALDNNWNMDQTIGDLDAILAMAQAIDTATVTGLVESLRPQHPAYGKFKTALARYRDIEQRGGWPSVPDGPALKPGMTDARIPVLRERLAVSGDMQATDPESVDFDSGLEAGVKRFQQRHGLTADGIVGKGTVAALNVPVQARIDQIRVNLERARWVLHNLPDEFVLVDIAGFNVRYHRDRKLAWETRAQVGKTYRKTPVFRSEIKYLEINPTWTVPPTILKKDILPKLKNDPGYLKKKDMRVLTHAGKTVDPATIDWQKMSGSRFPYMIRQNPGPRNALGRIKFMFPNEHLVYLHDTPSRSLFGRTERAFSSGCIRVEHPYDFAELLLNSDGWNKERIREVVDSKKTTRVNLPRPVTVILLYWTIDADSGGTVFFKTDLYQRDAAVLAGLQRPFHFRKSPVLDDSTQAQQ